MDARAILGRLSAAGVTLAALGDGLSVESRQPLTEQQRAWLREHKPALLALLSDPPPLTGLDHEAITEATEERAAIREFDGGEDRATAEREARSAMRVYHLLIAMPDGTEPKWATMLAPGCDLEEARRDACLRFGPERVLRCEPSRWNADGEEVAR